MIRPTNPDKSTIVKWLSGAAIAEGQIIILDTTAKPAAEGVSTTVILGVAMEDCASGATVKMYHPDQEFEFDIYQGGSTDVGAASMLGTKYDIYVNGAVDDGVGEGEMYIDFNDTTGAFVYLVDYDNDRRVAKGRFLRSLMLI